MGNGQRVDRRKGPTAVRDTVHGADRLRTGSGHAADREQSERCGQGSGHAAEKADRADETVWVDRADVADWADKADAWMERTERTGQTVRASTSLLDAVHAHDGAFGAGAGDERAVGVERQHGEGRAVRGEFTEGVALKRRKRGRE